MTKERLDIDKNAEGSKMCKPKRLKQLHDSGTNVKLAEYYRAQSTRQSRKERKKAQRRLQRAALRRSQGTEGVKSGESSPSEAVCKPAQTTKSVTKYIERDRANNTHDEAAPMENKEPVRKESVAKVKIGSFNADDLHAQNDAGGEPLGFKKKEEEETQAQQNRQFYQRR